MNSRGYDWEAIRRDYPLEAIVAKSIKLRSSGATKVACCPFHTEKTPSFHVYPDNSYHCFGCGAHGDVIDFVAGIEHIEPAEAIRRLTGGVAPSLSPDDFERRRKEQIAADKKREQAQ